MPNVDRTLLLKRVIQVPGKRFPQIAALDLHLSMAAVFDASATVWDRHYPARDKVKPGRRCVFFKRVERQGRAALFHAYSYIAGHTPDQVVFDDLIEQITADPIVTPAGLRKEIVVRFAVLVLGEVMIIESAQVNGSGQLTLNAMRDLIRRHHMPNHPAMQMEDAPTVEFQRMARIHGGVKSVTARLHSGFHADPQTFGDSMEKIIADRGLRASKISATIEAADEEELDLAVVESMLNESEDRTGLSSITITFRDNISLGDMQKYREKAQISVQQVRPGVPALNEIEAEMVGYLRKLANAADGNFQLITDAGRFT